jgi:protein-tyrosine phosphatase
MIDLHTHVLPGVDDGPATLDGSLELARAAADEGTSTLVATPHVAWGFPTPAATMHEGVARVNQALQEADIGVAVAPGAEIAHDMLARLDDDELRGLTLGGGPNILLEAPLSPVAQDFEQAFEDVRRRGLGVVLAHPERCPSFHRDPDRVARMVERGALCSITASAFTGRFGKQVRGLAERLLADGLVHDVASDTHDAVRRPPKLRTPLIEADRELPGLAALAPWLTEQVPAAILAGESPPPPPARPPRRRARRLLWSR